MSFLVNFEVDCPMPFTAFAVLDEEQLNIFMEDKEYQMEVRSDVVYFIYKSHCITDSSKTEQVNSSIYAKKLLQFINDEE
jgi:hypothetical protein